MVKLGGWIGGILGVAILFIFTEWFYVNTFADHDLVEGALIVGAAVLGALAGREIARRLTERQR